ncbi:MAG: endonuclease III [Puniceicoccales bacterium]|jgi:endonuclease-3|nr:endonuclease III [Puniceicoccales bacterium]
MAKKNSETAVKNDSESEMRTSFILKTLEEIYPNVTIPLDYRSPFSLLIAVILSAQCTDERVNRVTPVLFSMASDPQTMKDLPFEIIEKIIHPCGLFHSKARAIKGCAQIIAEHWDGKVPSTFEELEKLPGVGHKTASVMVSQCFNGYAFPVDTHIRRLANRWGLVYSQNVKIIENNLKKLFPKEEWHDLHIRMIRFGREYCPSKNHRIDHCPICRLISNFGVR